MSLGIGGVVDKLEAPGVRSDATVCLSLTLLTTRVCVQTELRLPQLRVCCSKNLSTWVAKTLLVR